MIMVKIQKNKLPEPGLVCLGDFQNKIYRQMNYELMAWTFILKINNHSNHGKFIIGNHLRRIIYEI